MYRRNREQERREKTRGGPARAASQQKGGQDRQQASDGRRQAHGGFTLAEDARAQPDDDVDERRMEIMRRLVDDGTQRRAGGNMRGDRLVVPEAFAAEPDQTKPPGKRQDSGQRGEPGGYSSIHTRFITSPSRMA